MVFHLTKTYKPSLGIVFNTCDKSTVAEGESGLVIMLDVLGRLGSEDISGANSLISKFLEPIHQQITFFFYRLKI